MVTFQRILLGKRWEGHWDLSSWKAFKVKYTSNLQKIYNGIHNEKFTHISLRKILFALPQHIVTLDAFEFVQDKILFNSEGNYRVSFTFKSLDIGEDSLEPPVSSV